MGKILRRSKRKKAAAVLFVLVFMCLLFGCESPATDHFAYQKECFCTNVRGTLNGREFTAVLKKEGDRQSVAYTEGALAGMEAVMLEGQITVRYCGMEIKKDETVLVGFMEPLFALMQEKEIETVERRDTEYILQCADSSTVRIAKENGAPTEYHDETVEFYVKSWNTKK